MDSRIYVLIICFTICFLSLAFQYFQILGFMVVPMPSVEFNIKNPSPKVVMSSDKHNTTEDDSNSIRVHFYEKPRWMHQFRNCEYNCTLTEGPATYSSSKVVVFHWPWVDETPPKKSPGQIWVLLGVESPLQYRNQLMNWTDMINWTLTYRRDSDLTSLYGVFKQLPKRVNVTVNWNTKDEIAAWFVSHCRAQSKRDTYTKLLQRFLDVHIYGPCGGNYSCPKNQSKACLEFLHKHYKLYLSFENSHCLDYASEKAFKLFRDQIDTIPVTRGGANYSLFLPPGSYLNTAHFETIEEVAKQMKTIAGSKENFKNYFIWKKTRRFAKPPNRMCELCKRVHKSEQYKRLYYNVGDWLTDKPRSACKVPNDLV